VYDTFELLMAWYIVAKSANLKKSDLRWFGS